MAADKPHPDSAVLAASGATRTSRGLRLDARPREGLITGFLLKLIRESAGLTQETLAEHLGVDTNTIQGWESDGGRSREPAWRRSCSYGIGSASSAPTRNFCPR
jgi:DNA-binding transcriptional regulator YiaG